MTVREKSIALWWSGAAIGFVAARAGHKSGFLGAVLGSILVGAVGDKLLEENERKLASAGN